MNTQEQFKEAEQWSVDDVVVWASKIPKILPEDINILKKQRIDGEALVTLTLDKLESFGIVYGPASKIFAEIEKLRPKVTPVDPKPLPGASQATIDFWNSLPKATFTSGLKENPKGKGKQQGEGGAKDNEGTFLDLGPSVYFLGDEKLGSKMFVRECYKELADVTMGIVKSGYNLVITGNPGIGKSYFLFFFMHFLRQIEDEPTVVLFRHLETRWYLFTKQGVMNLVAERADGGRILQKYLDDPNTWYLVDTAEPLQVKAKTLLVSSPYVERYKEFRKTHAMIRFMPIWTKEDIDICRKEFYNSPGPRYVSQARVDEVYNKWGGIPRYVLEKANIKSDQDDLDVALSKCTTLDIMTYTGAEGAPEHISHKLLHMVVERDPPSQEGGTSLLIDRYSSYEIDIASKYVAEKLTAKFGTDSRHQLELLRILQNRTDVPLLFGHLYENFAHQVIPRGGDFLTRNLSTGQSAVLHLKEKVSKPLSNIHDLSKVGKDEYGMGHNTFPGLDAIVSDPPTLFNMTVTRKEQRGVKDTTLKSALDNLPEETFPRPCHYHWVMPSNKFDNFQKQSVNGIRSMELDSMLEQFAMELSITEPVQKHSVAGDKRRKQATEQSAKEDTNSEEDGSSCKVILKSGPRKGKKCGRLNCSFHLLTDAEKPTKKQKK